MFLYAASDSSNAFRMFLLLLEFSIGPDPCKPAHDPNQQPGSQEVALLMGLPRSQGGLYFTAGLLTAMAQKTANLAALYLSFVIIGSGDSVRGWEMGLYTVLGDAAMLLLCGS